MEAALLQAPGGREPGDAAADNDDAASDASRLDGGASGAVAKLVAERHVVVDESALRSGDPAFAVEPDQRGGQANWRRFIARCRAIRWS